MAKRQTSAGRKTAKKVDPSTATVSLPALRYGLRTVTNKHAFGYRPLDAAKGDSVEYPPSKDGQLESVLSKLVCGGNPWHKGELLGVLNVYLAKQGLPEIETADIREKGVMLCTAAGLPRVCTVTIEFSDFTGEETQNLPKEKRETPKQSAAKQVEGLIE